MNRKSDSKPSGLDPSRLIGVPILDQQHEELVALLGQLAKEPDALITSESVVDMMTLLMKKLPEHFHDEETYMKSCGMPAILVKDHVDRHTKIAEELAHLQFDSMHNRGVKVSDIVRVVNDWILHHIDNVDLEIRKYIKQ